jgi:predicted metalloprotease with PDZ domain
VLSHELLHLWVPNGLALDGDYDWFYEGFTLYLAMRARMRQGQLSFQDYLNTLGRAFDAYAAARGSDEHSLVELSRRRWTGSSALVYNKGMLVAFLYDLALMRQTGGRSSLEDVYRALFRRFGGDANRADGNASAVAALGEVGAMREFVRLHVESPVAINLNASLAPFGLRAESFAGRTRVSVAESPGREQRELLKKLGYNEKSDEATRRLHEKLRKRTDKREN